jgi:hypothetical protein
MFASDEHDLQVMLREANELRRARGLQQIEPWWRVPLLALLPASPRRPSVRRGPHVSVRAISRRSR